MFTDSQTLSRSSYRRLSASASRSVPPRSCVRRTSCTARPRLPGLRRRSLVKSGCAGRVRKPRKVTHEWRRQTGGRTMAADLTATIAPSPTFSLSADAAGVENEYVADAKNGVLTVLMSQGFTPVLACQIDLTDLRVHPVDWSHCVLHRCEGSDGETSWNGSRLRATSPGANRPEGRPGRNRQDSARSSPCHRRLNIHNGGKLNQDTQQRPGCSSEA